MATGGGDHVDTRSHVSGGDIALFVQHVYKDLIIKHVRVGSIIGLMSIPEDFHETVNNIHAHENHHQHQLATREFLIHLDKHGQPSDYSLFLQLLEQEDYEYLPKLLRGDDTIDTDTHRQHCRHIQHFSQDISEHVDFDLLYRKLVEGAWMDTEDSELLRRLSSNNGMTSASKWLLYYVLPKRKENWLKQFLQILRDLDYNELVAMITGEMSEVPEEMESDTETLSPHDTDDEDSIKMNILADSGEAYSMKNNLDSPSAESTDLKPMTYIEKRGPSREMASKLANQDLSRVNDWAETTRQIPTFGHTDFPDDVSVVSSIEDNTLFDFELEMNVTQELIDAREVIKPLENRPYQDELARSAGQGNNVLIIAPTGCGKTVVALKIMQEHLARMDVLRKKGKVAFFANEVTLVDQQHEMCKGHFESSVRTTQIVGETKDKSKISLTDLIKINDVLFMTPQIVVDAVTSKAVASLSVFTMLVFDECHHVLSKHPTNKIMSLYLDLKLDGCTHLPQVVGLTASVGVGKKKAGSEKDGAVHHITSLCARLDATGGLVTVRENIKSLNEYTHFVETAIKTTGQRSFDTFKYCVIDNIMKKIEEKIIELNPKIGLEDEITPCTEKGTMAYKQWLSKLYFTVIPNIINPDIRQVLITYVQHLLIYNKALLINEDCRAREAMLCIEEAYSALYPTQHCLGETENWLIYLYSENHQTLERESKVHVNLNPKLLLLELEVTGQIQIKPESKILILVKTRDLTGALLRWMKETGSLRQLNPVVVTGCAPSHKGGMSRSEQIKAVKSFKWGNSRVAIATSVAEEGLDITQCSRVIRYEYVSDEIGMIQARGRASRVDDGTYSLITGNTMLAAREESNVRLEQVMTDSVEAIQKEFDEDSQRFQTSLLEIQRSDKMARDIAQKHGQKQKNADAYKLHCYKCNIFVCLTTDIRVLNKSHHMVMSPRIGSLITEITHKKPTQFDNIKKCSKIYCKDPKCRMDWGVGVTYENAKFAVLSLKGLLFYDRNGKQQHRKYWKDTPFNCQELTQDDLLNYEESF